MFKLWSFFYSYNSTTRSWIKCSFLLLSRTPNFSLNLLEKNLKQIWRIADPCLVTDISLISEVFCKKIFLKVLLNSQENACAGVSFVTKLQAYSIGVPFLITLQVWGLKLQYSLITCRSWTCGYNFFYAVRK